MKKRRTSENNQRKKKDELTALKRFGSREQIDAYMPPNPRQSWPHSEPAINTHPGQLRSGSVKRIPLGGWLSG